MSPELRESQSLLAALSTRAKRWWFGPQEEECVLGYTQSGLLVRRFGVLRCGGTIPFVERNVNHLAVSCHIGGQGVDKIQLAQCCVIPAQYQIRLSILQITPGLPLLIAGQEHYQPVNGCWLWENDEQGPSRSATPIDLEQFYNLF